MSDEETDNEEGGFVVHQLKWRSKVLNVLIARLDTRYEESRKTNRSKPREKRRIGDQSVGEPPSGAAKWTVDNSSSSETQMTDNEEENHHDPVDDESTGTPPNYTSSASTSMGTPPDRTSSASMGTGTPPECASGASSSTGTPHGPPRFTTRPTHLFNHNASLEVEGGSSSEVESDDELSSLIRAATMKMY